MKSWMAPSICCGHIQSVSLNAKFPDSVEGQAALLTVEGHTAPPSKGEKASKTKEFRKIPVKTVNSKLFLITLTDLS